MQRTQNQTLGLVFMLLLVVMAGVFAPAIVAFLASLFQYRQIQLDLNPLNPNFDYSQLVPKINVPNPFAPNPQPSTQTPNGVAILDPNGNPIVVPGAGGDPQIAPGVG